MEAEDNRFHYQRVWDFYDKDKLRPFFKSLGKIESFIEYRQHPLVKRHLEEVSRLATTSELSTQAQIFFHLYQMYANGEKILKVEKDLALQLFHTEIRGVKAEHLKTPFKEQYIAMPHGIQTIDRPENKGVHQVEGVYVFFNRLENGEHELRLMVIGTANEYSISSVDVGITYFRFYLNDSDNIQEVMRKVLAESLNEPESILSDGEYNQDRWPSIINFVVNVLLYATSPGADIHWQSWMDIDPKIKKYSGKKLEEKKQDLKKKNMLAGVLGGNLKLSHEERELYLSAMQHKRGPIGVAVLVRGHWRNQWYGSEADGTLVQKPKFIEPFWKGLNKDIISNKIHVLE